MNFQLSRSKNKIFGFLLVTLLIIAIVFIDLLWGTFSEIEQLRTDAKNFRSEVATLQLPTKNLVPETDHKYDNPFRPEGDQYFSTGTPRFFRTNIDGVIKNSKDGNENTQRPSLLFLGGSITESNEVDEKFRFPALVEHLLERDFALKVSSLNYGVRGHTTQDSINLLLNHPNLKKTHYVLLMHNINDRLILSKDEGYQASLSKTSPTSWANLKVSTSEFLTSLLDFVSYKSNVLFSLRMKLGNFNPWTGEEKNYSFSEVPIDFIKDDLDSRIKEFKANLEIFITTSRIFNQIPILMTQPLGQVSNNHLAFNTAIREISKENKVPIIDLDKKLPRERDWLFLSDNIHLNNNGSIFVAKIIAQDLANILRNNKSQNITSPVDLAELKNKCLPPPKKGKKFKPGPRHLLLDRSGRYPNFSSDGKKILFQTNENGFDRINLYDTMKKRYFELSDKKANYNDRHPTFVSEENNGNLTLAFGSNRSGVEQIYLLEWPSNKLELLMPNSSANGSIPSKGFENTILFAGNKIETNAIKGNTPELFSFNLKTKVLKQLTTNKNEEWRPVVNPNGRFVYHISNRSGNFDIFKMPIEGGKQELVYGTNADEWDPAISKDGRWLAFASKQNGNWDLYIMDLTYPKTVVQVTSEIADDWDPVFYPDNRVLAFGSLDGENSKMFALCVFGPSKIIDQKVKIMKSN